MIIMLSHIKYTIIVFLSCAIKFQYQNKLKRVTYSNYCLMINLTQRYGNCKRLVHEKIYITILISAYMKLLQEAATKVYLITTYMLTHYRFFNRMGKES